MNKYFEPVPFRDFELLEPYEGKLSCTVLRGEAAVMPLTYSTVEVFRIPIYHNIVQTTAHTVLSETGVNLKDKFPTVKQFLSWLNLVPDNKISGGKVLYSKVRKRKNHAGQVFREAANSLWKAKNPFGDYLRAKKARSGSGQAIVATAKKIATIFYKMVTEKVEFSPYIIHGDRQIYLQNKVKSLSITLKRLNLELAEFE